MKTYLVPAVIALTLLSAGCQNATQTPDNNETIPYAILSTQPYNNSLCGGTGFHYEEGGVKTGLRLIIKDAETQENFTGRAKVTLSDSSQGSIFAGESYSCDEGLRPQSEVLSVYAQGYSPAVFAFPITENQLADVEVSLQKSCTQGLTCLKDTEESMRLELAGNKTEAQIARENTKQYFENILLENFGINPAEIQLTCAECDMGRGGYIKAAGTIGNATFTLYRRTGWCRTGGGDCGNTICLTTNSDELIQKAENKICPNIYSLNQTEVNTEEGVYTVVPVSDTTNQTRVNCLTGAYTTTNGDTKTLALIQEANRYNSAVKPLTANCIEQ
ncbi:Uncharacterised protein [uncultured archaeon]|nr:Uncharacterised protein [uncultured archaeon]